MRGLTALSLLNESDVTALREQHTFGASSTVASSSSSRAGSVEERGGRDE